MSENNSEEEIIINNNSEQDSEQNDDDDDNYNEQHEYENYIQQLEEEEEERFQIYISSLQQNEEQNEEQNNEEDYDVYDRIVERFIIDLFSPQPLTSTTTTSTTTDQRYPRYIQNPIFYYSESTSWSYPNQSTEENYVYNSDGFILNSFLQSFSDPIESVMMESLNQQPGLERTFEKLEIDSQLYSSMLIDDIGKEIEKKCCICLSDFKSDDNVSVLNCKHLFHNDCIVEWSMYKINCPVCRENLKQE